MMLVLMMLALFVGGVVAAAAGSAGPVVGTIVIIVLLSVILVGYPIIFESLWGGRTLGKAALGLKVVTREGAPSRTRHAFVRGVLQLVEIIALPFIAVFTCAASRNNQRVGDLAAGTLVVRDRVVDRAAVSVTFPPPPGYEGYVASLDVSAVDEERYGLIRSFLVRVFDFTPGARAALAWRLANPVATEMHHAPPDHLSPELFLACVAAAYQQRHTAPAGGWGYAAPGWDAAATSSWYPPPSDPYATGYAPAAPPPNGYPDPAGYPAATAVPNGYPPATGYPDANPSTPLPWLPPPPAAPTSAAPPSTRELGPAAGVEPAPLTPDEAWPEAPPSAPPG